MLLGGNSQLWSSMMRHWHCLDLHLARLPLYRCGLWQILKKKQWPPSLGFHLCIYILSLRSCRDFVPILLIRLKYFQEFGWSPPVNTGKVNLTRFSKTFGVFSSLSLHFVFEQRQWGLWAIKENLFGIAGCVFQAPPKNCPSQVRKKSKCHPW